MKTLILKSDRGSFEKFYIKNMTLSGVTTEAIYRPMNEILRYFSVVWLQKLNIPFGSIWYGRWKKKLSSYDKVIIFESYNWNIIEYIKHKNPRCRIIVWYWNPITEKNRLPVKYRNMCEEWSFDKANCEKYHLNYNVQFTFKRLFLNRIRNKGNYMYFVGKDKGRGKILKDLKDCLETSNLETKFIIVKDKTSALKGVNYSNPISYEQNLQYLLDALCIVDIVQKQQTGLTVRCVEALYLQKKIITNNVQIRKYSFFNSNNIYILKESKIYVNELLEFIAKPYVPLEDSVYDKYDFANWCENFDL